MQISSQSFIIFSYIAAVENSADCRPRSNFSKSNLSAFSYTFFFQWSEQICSILKMLNPTALSMAKTQWSFGHSECNRVKVFKLLTDTCTFRGSKSAIFLFVPLPNRNQLTEERICSHSELFLYE